MSEEKNKENRIIQNELIDLMVNSNSYTDSEIEDFTIWIDGLINESDKNNEDNSYNGLKRGLK